MKMRGHWTAAIFAGLTLSGFTAKAQSLTGNCTPGVRGYIGYGVTQNARVPYTVTIKTNFEQKLPDGNVIRGATTVHSARDSSGKTRTETVSDCFRGQDGQVHRRVNVNIYDPAIKTSMFWDVGGPMGKIIHVSHSNDTPQLKLTPEEMEEQRKWFELRQPRASESKTERLGTKTIAGVTAEGSRTTRTIPTGEEGNDLPLTTMSETWRSRELNVTLSEIRDDPRRGKTTMEVEEFTPGEPDPALFAPPPGYKVLDEKVVVTTDPPTP